MNALVVPLFSAITDPKRAVLVPLMTVAPAFRKNHAGAAVKLVTPLTLRICADESDARSGSEASVVAPSVLKIW